MARAKPTVSVDGTGKITAATSQAGGFVLAGTETTELQQETVQQATPTISVASDGVITATATQTAGFVAQGTKTATLAQETVPQATPSITVNGSGLITASATQTAGFVSAGTKSATLQQTTVEQATPTISVANDGTVTASATQTGGFVASGTKSATYSLPTQAAKTVTPTESAQTAVTAGKWTTGAVQVGAIPSDYFKPSGTLPITSNGTYDVKSYASTSVNVPGITPTGTLPITSNGTYDVTNYAGANVNVAGGGGSVIIGALRPDAELWKSWTYDKMIVADEGVAIPTYSTSARTLKDSETLEVITLDRDNYDYVFVARALAYPIYSEGTIISSGRLVCGLTESYYEFKDFPAGSVVDNGNATGALTYLTREGAVSGKIVYYASETNLTSGNGYSFGTIIDNLVAENSGSNITVVTPRLKMCGSSTIYSSYFWERTTDVRYQYVMELYRVPRANQTVRGFAWESLLIHAAECYNAIDHTLT